MGCELNVLKSCKVLNGYHKRTIMFCIKCRRKITTNFVETFVVLCMFFVQCLFDLVWKKKSNQKLQNCLFSNKADMKIEFTLKTDTKARLSSLVLSLSLNHSSCILKSMTISLSPFFSFRWHWTLNEYSVKTIRKKSLCLLLVIFLSKICQNE